MHFYVCFMLASEMRNTRTLYNYSPSCRNMQQSCNEGCMVGGLTIWDMKDNISPSFITEFQRHFYTCIKHYIRDNGCININKRTLLCILHSIGENHAFCIFDVNVYT